MNVYLIEWIHAIGNSAATEIHFWVKATSEYHAQALVADAIEDSLPKNHRLTQLPLSTHISIWFGDDERSAYQVTKSLSEWLLDYPECGILSTDWYTE